MLLNPLLAVQTSKIHADFVGFPEWQRVAGAQRGSTCYSGVSVATSNLGRFECANHATAIGVQRNCVPAHTNLEPKILLKQILPPSDSRAETFSVEEFQIRLLLLSLPAEWITVASREHALIKSFFAARRRFTAYR